jgi:peptidoglycan/LPS O-acetylase OafA/YrhL
VQSARAARESEGFRPEIEGLRGVAVLLVVLFHAGVVAIPGGFIGVDVFFVISGFLITGLLIREREQTGGVRLATFYARRVRRLLPAGMLTLACTLVASFAILSPLDLPSAAGDGAAAALSVGNVRFALAAGDYFASVESPSPFLHFWSLAVEEQFYLVWPALILLAGRGSRPRLGAGLALGLVFVGSLVANVVVTDIAVNWAFYSLPTRAWQLALGGLVALGIRRLGAIPDAIRATAGWAGLALLLGAAFLLDGSIAYPGLFALAPTLGSAALILSGTSAGGPGGVLSTAPIRFLGRISYSLYLWHWPILVLSAAAAEGARPATASALLVAVAVVVAWLSWRFVEEPFRVRFPTLARRPHRTILAGAAVVALVVSMAGGLVAVDGFGGDPSRFTAIQPGPGSNEPLDLDPSWLDETSSPGPPPSSPGPTASASPSTVPPEARETPVPTATPQAVVRLPSNVRPPLADARGDEERLRQDGCLGFESATRPPECGYGDPQGAFTVALVGDSHAAQWFPALERIAIALDWRVMTYVKVACPFIDMRVDNIALKREYRECAAWNEATLARLRASRPDLTLVSMSRFAIHPTLEADGSLAAQGAALARMLDRIPGRVAVIVDTPDAGRDVPGCLARHVADVRVCAIDSKVAFAGSLGAIERAAAAASGAGLIDLTARICRADPCPVVVDRMIVFRDMRHLTATFSRSLARDLDRAIRTVLASG